MLGRERTGPQALVIPARLGSKRIPEKNLYPLHGRPLIVYPLKAALDSSSSLRIIVSSDDIQKVRSKIRHYLDASELCRIEFHNREAELANDVATSLEVVRNVIKEKDLYEYEVFMAYPTSIFLDTDLFSSLRAALCKDESSFVATVIEHKHCHRSLTLNRDGHVLFSNPEFSEYRSQDLPVKYEDAAQLYFGDAQDWMTSGPFRSATKPVSLPPDSVCDIDYPSDIALAKSLLLKKLQPGREV